MSKAFWRGFWEGMNPLWMLAWLLFGAGHVVSLLLRFDACAWMYPAYNKLMLWSVGIQDRFGFSGPWGEATMDDRYGDGSDHIACPLCGLCRSCRDCKCPEAVKPARGKLEDASK